MTWNDFYRRQQAIQAVLDHAREHPDEQLTLQAVPEASTVSADTQELLCALYYKWTQALTGRIGVALADAEQDPHSDRVQAVTAAWRQTAADNAALRRILDSSHATEPSSAVRSAMEREERLLALASGLAEYSEPTAEIARVGAAFLSLLQATPSHRATIPMEQLRNRIPTV